MAKQKHKSLTGYLYTIAVLAVCIVINAAGRRISYANSLPIWMDTMGTFFAAYTFGPISGAIVGVSSNIIVAFWIPASLPFALVNLYIGIGVGLLARKKYFNDFFHTMNVAGAITTGSVLIATILNVFINDFNTANLWGDGVKNFMVESGMHKSIALFIGEIYIEFPDKLISALVMFFLIKIVRRVRKNGISKTAKSTAAAAAAVAVMLSVCAQASDFTAHAEEKGSDVSYIQTIFNGENGLACGHANAIAQTRDGIMWIGTYAGLYRYSGSEFAHLNSLDDVRNVNCLFVDNESRLWIGTNDNGVVIAINGKITNVLGTDNGLPANSIRSIVQSSDGTYYIGTIDSMITAELKIGINIKTGIAEVGNVDRMSADKNGNVAAVNNQGKLFILNDSKIITTLDLSDKGKKISACSFAQDGTLYIGTTDGLVSRYTIEDKSLKNISDITCRDTTKINNIYPDQDGIIWICADSGIGFINEKSIYYSQKTGDFNHSVESMLRDYQGNLWFASSRQGLLRMSRSAVADIYADTGLEPSVVNATAIRNGLLYAGTDDGLTIISVSTHTSFNTSLTDLLKGTRIRCMINDSSHDIWICSYGKGLLCVDRYGETINYSQKFSEIGDRVRVCMEMNDGTIAVSSSTGLYFIKDGALKKSIPLDSKIGQTPTLCFLQTSDGTLYAGTDGNGILVIRNYEVVSTISRADGLTSDVILRLVSDYDEKGIYVVTSNSLGFMQDSKVRTLKAFPYSNNYDVIVNNDKIFVTGSAGVYVMNKKELLDDNVRSSFLLDSKLGLIGSLTANAWNTIDKDNNLYLCSERGVYMINLDNYQTRQKYFRLMVSEVRIDDKAQSIERDLTLKVDRDTTKLELVPEIINYTHSDPTVSYYLEGFQDGWTDVAQSEIKTIAYTNLKPGNYTFHIAIKDDNGSIIEESTYDIVKQKAIHDNSWFKYYMLGVAAIFIGWLTWFITRTQMTHTLELQQTKLTMALHQVQMGNETILAIAKTVDAKDLKTSKHSQRVSEYSAMIAKEYGFTDEQCENLRKAALLHDIGKIAIPDSVLNKPARLTDEEYAVMKSHVTRGAEILKDFTLIDHVVEGARFHHERFDGRGYPDGLKGDEIPLYGRIIAIADAFDAMTANRVYRQRQDFDYVLNELHKNRGTQFDPELLDIFLKLIDDKKIDIDALYRGEHQKGED